MLDRTLQRNAARNLPDFPRYLWRELYGGVYGRTRRGFMGESLFHSVPYYKRAKDTLCTDKYNKLGQQASMGCVRLTVEDANGLRENCPEGTTVEIYDGKTRGRSGNRRRKNWINQIRTATGIRLIRMRKILAADGDVRDGERAGKNR